MARPRSAKNEIAAVDLGSNSFHLVVAREEHGQLLVVDRLRERIALGAGLDDSGRLSPEMQARALNCIRRFGQRLQDVPSANVRAVGTNALRVAKNSRGFLARAALALGHPVEVIPGREEARLIYLGVAHSEPEAAGRRLVVDIGGGSTEVIVGERFESLRTESLYMGCVSWTRRYFADGKITAKALKRARIAARLEVQTIARAARSLGWDEALGASGTILAIDSALRAAGRGDRGITESGLEWLCEQAIRAGRTERLQLPGLDPERAEVLPGGISILLALFEGLRGRRMRAAAGALREGVLYDLLGRSGTRTCATGPSAASRGGTTWTRSRPRASSARRCACSPPWRGPGSCAPPGTRSCCRGPHGCTRSGCPLHGPGTTSTATT